MKRIKSICIIIAAIFLCNNCTNRKQLIPTDELPIVVNIQEVLKQGWLTIDSTKCRTQYIPLETNEKCLIGSITKTILYQNKIFVADFFDAMSLFVFDLHGRFLYKIDKRGNGPGEYLSFNDFDIDRNGDIYIYDVYNTNFLVYDSIGYYKNTIHMKHQISSFFILDNNIYCSDLIHYEQVLANLAVFNITNNKVEHIIPSRKILDDYHYINNSTFKFYRSLQHAYYCPKFSSIVYFIDDNSVKPTIGITNLNIPPENVLLEWIDNSESMLYDSDYYQETTYIYETDQYIFLTIKMVPTIYLLYNKIKDKYYNLDSLYPSIGISTVKGSDGKLFWGIMEPDENDHKELMKTQKILKEWKEEDNPVIVFIEFNL